jgi:hypothetical protein
MDAGIPPVSRVLYIPLTNRSIWGKIAYKTSDAHGIQHFQQANRRGYRSSQRVAVQLSMGKKEECIESAQKNHKIPQLLKR